MRCMNSRSPLASSNKSNDFLTVMAVKSRTDTLTYV